MSINLGSSVDFVISIVNWAFNYLRPLGVGAFFGAVLTLLINQKIIQSSSRQDVVWLEKRDIAKRILRFVDKGQNSVYKTNLTQEEKDTAMGLISLVEPHSIDLRWELYSFVGFWSMYLVLLPLKLPEHQISDHEKYLQWNVDQLDANAERVRTLVSHWLK